MASRANVPVFQPHATAAGVRTKSPPGSKLNPNLAPAPSGPPVPGEREPNLQPTTRRRSSSTTGRRRANSTRQREPPLQFPGVFESEPPPPPQILDPNTGNKSDSALTPGSSAEWNGSPPMPAIAEEHLGPETPHQQSQPIDKQVTGSQSQSYQSFNPYPPSSQPRDSPSHGTHQQRIQPPTSQSPINRSQGLEPLARDEPLAREPG